MIYYTFYQSPIGNLLLVANNDALTGIEFDISPKEDMEKKLPGATAGLPEILVKTISWLNAYFHGENPGPIPKVIFEEGTEFQKKVWSIVAKIPYGQSMSYQAIANIITEERPEVKMSAQAVGQAVGKNPIPIVVPCHRVLGYHGDLTGYRGGLEKKKLMLCLEQIPYKQERIR